MASLDEGVKKVLLGQGVDITKLGLGIADETSQDQVLVVNVSFTNDSGEAITLDEKSTQEKVDGSVAAPSSLGSGKTSSFTVSPGDDVVFGVAGSTISVRFKHDKKAPKIELGDELKADEPPVGVEITETEVELEIETEEKTEKKTTRTVGKQQPETKKTKTEKTETETPTTSTETKIETKIKKEDLESKITVTKKTETKKKETSFAVVVYNAK
ncbi:hypothetical protein DRE_02987 [Drechslerella stenobrocha 248]|uniref:DUF4352 domain-containing protein n=1 Tax=Drechslerella stenobrocha 248 TaxID=1043628 RepID=W7I5P5_9PEZI|nr:hypothetical protein DRE_02987 [Drechslerella stenobrocha 248]